MDPLYDPRVRQIFSTPQAYEQLYRRGLPPSDFLAQNRSAILPGERTANDVQTIYRALGGSPEKVPMGPPGRRFEWMAEAPRPTARPAGFPQELLNTPSTFREGFASVSPGLGGVALQLIPYLLMLQGDTNPDIATWRAERAMVTPPDRARSVPDRTMAMPRMSMDPEVSRIQELADLIAARRGRD